jgi:Flp pilus assembly pilin Flp
MQMNPKRLKSHHVAKGQGLVEYALILALVALVVIAVTFLIGLSVQRVYGLVVGALGINHGSSALNIESSPPPACYLVGSTTNIYLKGYTNQQFSELTFSTNLTYNSDASGTAITPIRAAPGNSGTSGAFEVGYQLAPVRDRTKCPTTAVIQAQDGTIATTPIIVIERP